MRQVKTSELTGPALDWAVAHCQDIATVYQNGELRRPPAQFSDQEIYSPSTNWEQGGPIIEDESITIIRHDDDYATDKQGFTTTKRIPVWGAEAHEQNNTTQSYEGEYFEDPTYLIGSWDMSYGPTPLVAAMRAYVNSRIGSTVSIPDQII
jgi:hypothetical protein